MNKFITYLWIALVGLTLFAFTLFLLLGLMSFLISFFTDLEPMKGQSFYRGGVHFFFYAAFIGTMMIVGIIIGKRWRRGSGVTAQVVS